MKRRSFIKIVFLILILAIACLAAWHLVGNFLKPSTYDSTSYQQIDEAVLGGDTTQVKKLIQKNPNVIDLATWDGLTPLHLAAMHCHEDVAALLLSEGANSKTKAKDGTTPLHLAAQVGCTTVVESLIRAGVDINSIDSKGWTPMRRAKLWHHSDVAGILAKNGGHD